MKSWIPICVACLGACANSDRGESGAPPKNRTEAAPAMPADDKPSAQRDEVAKEKADEGKMGRRSGGGPMKLAAAMPPEPEKPKAGETETQVRTRAWFPETFLFTPLVVTDAHGRATVSVKVPDRLTTWRVLALAHSNEGSQAGAVTSFLGTLPAYLEPVLPPALRVGDEVRIPIQVVNTAVTPLSTTLRLGAEGAEIQGGGPVTVPAESSVVVYGTLRAPTPGTARLRFGLGETDAVVRSLEVLPLGRPVSDTVTGTLAAPRSLALVGPQNAEPLAGRVRLLVFPGALAILRSELGASLARGGVADDAYALLLAGQARTLLASFGDTPDEEALRRLALVGAQRVVKAARTLDVQTAALLTEAALRHSDNPILARLGERSAAFLAAKQLPDGTIGGGAGWTLQRLLVTTAECTRAVRAAAGTPAGKQRAALVDLRASGAFERQLGHIDDGYTAAALLASGALSGDLAARLRAIVAKHLVSRPDGAKLLEVAPGVVRPDGLAPSPLEATALAVLALDGSGDAALADLGAALLGGYQPVHGWGDGRANLVALAAVMRLFKEPIPPNVQIALGRDGKPLAEGRLDRDRVREVLALTAPTPGGAGAHEFTITATPAVPGLGYSLTIDNWVTWPKPEPTAEVELQLPETVSAAVERATELPVRVAAPAGVELRISVALPAGCQVDKNALDQLVAANVISSYATPDGAVDLVVPPLATGAIFATQLRVVPTLAGRLHAGASRLTVAGSEIAAPPALWTIK